MRESRGGGEVSPRAPERRTAADIAVPFGYQIELVASDLTFPTGIAFDSNDRPHVVESGYSYGEVLAVPRLIEIDSKGGKRVVAQGRDNGPWNGVSFANDAFFVAEGGVKEGGKILRISPAGKVSTIVEDLPSYGDHHTNSPVVRDGWVYFGQGTATNSGVVGADNLEFGWLKRFPQFHDVPCKDVELRGENYSSTDVLHADSKDSVKTSAFAPFGTERHAGEKIQGQARCNGAVLRVPVQGGEPEVFAWGLRNPYGLAFNDKGELYATENAFDVRGSRPIFGAPDVLWRILPDAWYGWPDYAAGIPVSSELFDTPKVGIPKPVLQSAPTTPPKPIAKLAVHSSSSGFDISRSEKFGLLNHAFIAQFGDQAPAVGKVWAPVGYKVIMVDLKTGMNTDFAVNRGAKSGPASALKSGGLERPIAARFNSQGEALYVVDFGVLHMDDDGKSHPKIGTGTLWRISKTGGVQ